MQAACPQQLRPHATRAFSSGESLGALAAAAPLDAADLAQVGPGATDRVVGAAAAAATASRRARNGAASRRWETGASPYDRGRRMRVARTTRAAGADRGGLPAAAGPGRGGPRAGG